MLEDVGGGEGLDEAAALLGVGFVEDDGGDLADVGVDCVAEEEELEDGDEEREEESGGVAEDVGEFFAGDGAEAEEVVLRGPRSCADGGPTRTAVLRARRESGCGGVVIFARP